MMLFGRDLAIDLGTTSVLLAAKSKGVILREPAVVAMDKNTGRLLKIGMAAQRMLGRTISACYARNQAFKTFFVHFFPCMFFIN